MCHNKWKNIILLSIDAIAAFNTYADKVVLPEELIYSLYDYSCQILS